MDRFTVLVRPSPPGVVPEPAPAALLLIADQVRDHTALSLQLGEPTEDGETGGTSSNDANLANHFVTAELLTCNTIIILSWNCGTEVIVRD